MGAYFRLNYRQEPASKWPELKARFFQFLVEHHSEWKSIRNNDPLGYLPYMEKQFEAGNGVQTGGPWDLHGVDPSGYLLPLGDSSAGATRSVPPPCWYPSTCRSNDAPTIPASNGGPAGNGSPASNSNPPLTAVAPTVPNPPQGGGGRPQAESQPRKRDAAAAGVQGAARGYWGCRRLLWSGQRSYLQGVPLLKELLQEAAAILVEEKGSQAVCSISPPRAGWPPSGRPVAV